MDAAENRREWAERSGEFSPEYYAQLGPNKASSSLVTAFEQFVDEDATVLELGCSSGRHLAHLRENGFENLTGIDINEESFAVMADHFPELADTGTFHVGAVEDVLQEFEAEAFDVVYSVETLQHVHTDDEWVFEDVARVTGDLLVTIENEGNSHETDASGRDVSYINGEFPLYYRNWKRVFEALGLVQLRSKSGERDTIRVFGAP